jgi:serine/threonine protein kinase
VNESEVQKLVGDRFVVRHAIGRGGYATVYEALDIHLRSVVAIKVLHADLVREIDLQRMRREARVMARMHHPNIVRLMEFGEDGRLAYCVLERLYGGTVAERLSELVRRPKRICALLAGVAHGLAEAHALGVVHRDLKPANVFVTDNAQGNEVAKLLDFGIARVTGSALTKTGVVLGTPRYMSPEQALGTHVDWRVDLYALGVMAWELFAGAPLFGGKSNVEIIGRHLHEVPSSVDKCGVGPLPAGLADLVAQLLAKRPGDRGSSASAVATRFDRYARLCAPDADPGAFKTDDFGVTVTETWVESSK